MERCTRTAHSALVRRAGLTQSPAGSIQLTLSSPNPLLAHASPALAPALNTLLLYTCSHSHSHTHPSPPWVPSVAVVQRRMCSLTRMQSQSNEATSCSSERQPPQLGSDLRAVGLFSLFAPLSLVRFSALKGPAVHASNWGVSGTGTCLANAGKSRGRQTANARSRAHLGNSARSVVLDPIARDRLEQRKFQAGHRCPSVGIGQEAGVRAAFKLGFKFFFFFSATVLIQTRAYWEITILEAGTWWIGVAQRSKEGLEKQLGERPNSWGLFSGVGGQAYKPGDVLSISYDLSGIRAVLLFKLNGVAMDTKVDGIKGDVFPAVSVADGAVLQANFGAMPYKYPMPEGFSPIILSKDLI